MVFDLALAEAVFRAGTVVCEERNISTVALSGGVFQNMLLLRFIAEKFAKGAPHLTLWTNNLVPANDGGLSLGQAALV
ncbi:MAG: hypothetical protein ACOVSW_10185 [Candidatus Kapaibacteriota bacterium]